MLPGKRLRVLPRPTISEALSQPLTGRLLVTDCGLFPAAASHRQARADGSPQTIVIICTDGEGWCTLPGDTVRVGPGEALIIPAHTPHVYGAAAEDPWTIWWLHLTGADVEDLLGAGDLDVDDPVIAISDVYRAVLLVDEVLRHMEHDTSTASQRAAAGAAWHLLALLVANRARLPATRMDAIQQAKDYLRERPDARTSVAELARLAGMSPSHFAALFRRATGMAVLEYQIAQRMSRARALLDTPTCPSAPLPGPSVIRTRSTSRGISGPATA
jgi:AraC family transcriptional regulator, arabinose operon regulatory protein